MMFNKIDHLNGAFKVRLRRFILGFQKKPDMVFLEPNLGIGGVSSVDSLQKCGINAILDLRLEERDDPSDLEKYSIDYLNIGIPDREVPDFDSAMKATNWINLKIDQGQKVFVHCNLGRGRAPLLAVAYLITHGRDQNEAINQIRSIRPYCFFNKKQLNWINEFEKNEHKI